MRAPVLIALIAVSSLACSESKEGTATSQSRSAGSAPGSASPATTVEAPTPRPVAQTPRPPEITEDMVAGMDRTVVAFEHVMVTMETAGKDCAKGVALWEQEAPNRKLIVEFVPTTKISERARQWFHDNYRMKLQSLTLHMVPTIQACSKDERFMKAIADVGWGLPF